MDLAIPLEVRRIDLRIEPAFQLGRIRVDPPAHAYVLRGASRRIQPQMLKVLVALHDKIGELVTREELVDRCWDGRIIGEDVINRCISLLRRIAEQGGGFRIDTVPRAGYRLIELSQPARTGRRYWFIGAAALALGATAAVAVLVSHNQAAAPEGLTVAVLPFTAEQGGPIEQTAATDARASVTRMLTESGVAVEDGDVATDPGRAAPDLLVSGHIGEVGRTILATVTVEESPRRAIILSHQVKLDLADAADLPDEVGANIAGSLSWADPLIRLDERHASDSAALSQMLDQFSNEAFDFWRTYEFARRHAPSAPNFAIAQWQLAMVTGLLMHGLPPQDRAQAVAAAASAADRARSLDPQIGDFTIPWCLLRPPVRMAECEDHLRAGLAADPQAAWAPSFLGHLMNNVGRVDEALTLEDSSLASDPYAPSKIAQTLLAFEAAGGSAQAEALYERADRLWPSTHFLFVLRVEGMTERGDFDAIARLEQHVGAANLPSYYDSALTLAQAVKARSITAAKAACPKSSIDFKIAQCMVAFGDLGDLDDAFAYADLVYPQRRARTLGEEEARWFADPAVLDTSFLVGRGAAPMRRDPRYLTLAERLGLLDYWRRRHLPDFCTKVHEPVCAQIRMAG